MTEFVQYLVSGLTLSAIYATLALGWSLGWSVARVLNLMVGEYLVVAALSFASFYQGDGWPLPVAAAAAVGVALVAGLVTDVLLRITRAADVQSALIVTLAAALMTHEVSAMIWGRQSVVVGPLVEGPAVEVFGAMVTRQVILVVSLAALLIGAVGVGLKRTRYGRAMRACAEDPVGASWCGIRSLQMRTATILLTAFVGGIAGVIVVPLAAIDFGSGIPMAVKGLIAAILGGLGSTGGAIAGALVVGVSEAFIAGYLSSERAAAVLFAGLIVILLAAPNGLVSGLSRLRRRDVGVV